MMWKLTRYYYHRAASKFKLCRRMSLRPRRNSTGYKSAILRLDSRRRSWSLPSRAVKSLSNGRQRARVCEYSVSRVRSPPLLYMPNTNFSGTDELEALEDLHQWRAVKLDANLKEFLYASRIKVSIPCVAHRPDPARLHVERTKASRMKERDEFPELSELMLIGAPHVVAASRKEPDLRTVSSHHLSC